MGVYREGPKMRSLLEGSRKARESCRAILTFDRQKGGPKMSQNVSYFDILGFQKVGHKMWSTRSTRLLRVWGTPKCHFWDPCWHTLDKTGILWTGKVGIFGYIVQKGVKKGSKRGQKGVKNHDFGVPGVWKRVKKWHVLDTFETLLFHFWNGQTCGNRGFCSDRKKGVKKWVKRVDHPLGVERVESRFGGSGVQKWTPFWDTLFDGFWRFWGFGSFWGFWDLRVYSLRFWRFWWFWPFWSFLNLGQKNGPKNDHFWGHQSPQIFSKLGGKFNFREKWKMAILGFGYRLKIFEIWSKCVILAGLFTFKRSFFAPKTWKFHVFWTFWKVREPQNHGFWPPFWPLFGRFTEICLLSPFKEYRYYLGCVKKGSKSGSKPWILDPGVQKCDNP